MHSLVEQFYKSTISVNVNLGQKGKLLLKNEPYPVKG